MPSFAAIVAFASITLSAVVSALPTVAPILSTVPSVVTAVTVPVPVSTDIGQVIGVSPREASSIESILDTASREVTTLIAQISTGVVGKAASAIDVSALVDITVQIQDVIGGAVDDCKAASGSPNIDIDVAVKIVIELIQNICAIIQVVIDACSSIDISVFLSAAVQVCVQLAALVKLLITLDAGVLFKILVQIAADLRLLIDIHADAFLGLFGV